MCRLWRAFRRVTPIVLHHDGNHDKVATNSLQVPLEPCHAIVVYVPPKSSTCWSIRSSLARFVSKKPIRFHLTKYLLWKPNSHRSTHTFRAECDPLHSNVRYRCARGMRSCANVCMHACQRLVRAKNCVMLPEHSTASELPRFPWTSRQYGSSRVVFRMEASIYRK